MSRFNLKCHMVAWLGLLTLSSLCDAQAAVLHACRVDGFAQQVQCGEVQRPLDPAAPNGKQIAVHFVVLPAMDKNKAPDPVFLLAGGPGQSAISVASYMQVVFDKLQRRHDLVFVDQRGTGKSAPLECPEQDDMEGIGQPDYDVRFMMACLPTLQKLPWGDLRFYTTTIAMQDLDSVRDALGYTTIDLIGVSYGTRAALEYQRLYPDHVRRTVLDGVVQPDQLLSDDDLQKVLVRLMDDCSTDARCHKAYPALAQDWARLLSSLPRQTTLTHPRLGTPLNVTVRRDDVLAWVSKVFYSPVSSAGLPHAIEAALDGNFNPLLTLSGAGALPGPGGIALGMHFSTVCAEEYDRLLATSSGDVNAGNDFGDRHRQTYLHVCRGWPRGTVSADFYTTPVSRTAVLLLSGGIDPVTPPWHADKVATALGPLARHIVLDHSGHGTLQQICMTDVATDFVNARDDRSARDVDASCIRQIPRPSVWIAPAPSADHSTERQP